MKQFYAGGSLCHDEAEITGKVMRMDMRLLAMIALLCASGICWAQQDSLALCLAKLASDPRFSSISAKVALGTVSSTPFSILADASIANSKERQAIADWAAARSE